MAAKGDYIAFLDADDIWVPEKLALQIAAFTSDPTLDIVTGYVEQFISPELDDQSMNKYRLQSEPLTGFIPIALLVRRGIFGIVGFFDVDYRVGEAVEFYTRVTEMDFKIKVLPELLARRRIHGENYSIKFQKEKNKAMLRILKVSIDRKRSKILYEK